MDICGFIKRFIVGKIFFVVCQRQKSKDHPISCLIYFIGSMENLRTFFVSVLPINVLADGEKNCQNICKKQCNYSWF